VDPISTNDPTEVPPISVRAATIDDAESVTDINVKAWQTAYRGIMPDQYLDELDNDRANAAQRHRVHIAQPNDPRIFDLVAECEGEVVGWLGAGPTRRDDQNATQGEIWAAYVRPDMWRSGVGGRLMAAALERLAADGYTEAVLWVFEENAGARAFYEQLGWRSDGATALFERSGCRAVEIRYRRFL
jgi:GNAT superfamily N-acetyltransferase